jgi:hypothetical protein
MIADIVGGIERDESEFAQRVARRKWHRKEEDHRGKKLRASIETKEKLHARLHRWL